MAFKPFGADENGNVPARVRAAIAKAAELKAVFTDKYASASTAANTRRVLSMLTRNVSDVSILVISDSTANEQTEWAYLTAVDLAAKFPAYTVEFAFWDETGGTGYQAPITLQTGTDTNKLRFWCCARAGEIPGYVLGSRWSAAVVAPAPDLVIVNHGHNMPDPTGVAWKEQAGRAMMMSLTEEVTATFPRAGLILIAQNPSKMAGRETWQAIKANAWEDLASIRGYGFIDVHQAFLDYGNWQADLMLDDTHPNAKGSRLWADVVGAAFKEQRGAGVPTVNTPPLLTSGKNYIDNYDFSAWSGTNPDAWTPNAAAATSKDTTNVEVGVQGCKVTANTTSGLASLAQSYNLAVKGYRHLKGQVVTLAVRVFVPASNTAVVRVEVKDSTGSVNARSADIPTSTRDRFVWLYASKRLDPAATDLYVTLYPRTSGTATVDATFDRVHLVQGVLPRCN